jgi:nucleoside 2-deoxyribosyltransferase
MIALLDGSQVDVGTSSEIGYFYARQSSEQKIVGIGTEFLWARDSVVNAMVEGACDWIVRSSVKLLADLSGLLIYPGRKSLTLSLVCVLNEAKSPKRSDSEAQ